MLLRNAQIIALIGHPTLGVQGALNALHGRRQPILKDKKTSEVALTEEGKAAFEDVPYNFKPGTRMKLALIQSKLAPPLDAFNSARDEIIKKFKSISRQAGDKNLEPTSECWDDFNNELRELLQTETDVERLPALTEEDLMVDENKLPSNVLTSLIVLIKETE